MKDHILVDFITPLFLILFYLAITQLLRPETRNTPQALLLLAAMLHRSLPVLGAAALCLQLASRVTSHGAVSHPPPRQGVDGL